MEQLTGDLAKSSSTALVRLFTAICIKSGAQLGKSSAVVGRSDQDVLRKNTLSETKKTPVMANLKV